MRRSNWYFLFQYLEPFCKNSNQLSESSEVFPVITIAKQILPLFYCQLVIVDVWFHRFFSGEFFFQPTSDAYPVLRILNDVICRIPRKEPYLHRGSAPKKFNMAALFFYAGRLYLDDLEVI